MNRIPSILILVALAVAAFGSPPMPESEPPAMHEELLPVYESGGTIIIHGRAPVDEWELTFEWQSDLGTNPTHRTYPIKVQVPFEHDEGFVFVRARKVKGALPGGQIGLPTERFALPQVAGARVVVLDWHRQVAIIDVPYDNSGFFDFHLPAWNRWYFAGLLVNEEYVWSKWIGHFLSGGE